MNNDTGFMLNQLLAQITKLASKWIPFINVFVSNGRAMQKVTTNQTNVKRISWKYWNLGTPYSILPCNSNTNPTSDKKIAPSDPVPKNEMIQPLIPNAQPP